MEDLVRRQDAIDAHCELCGDRGLPDLAYSIIGDVMRCLDVPEAKEAEGDI